jgi:hypothetical protein
MNKGNSVFIFCSRKARGTFIPGSQAIYSFDCGLLTRMKGPSLGGPQAFSTEPLYSFS